MAAPVAFLGLLADQPLRSPVHTLAVPVHALGDAIVHGVGVCKGRRFGSCRRQETTTDTMLPGSTSGFGSTSTLDRSDWEHARALCPDVAMLFIAHCLFEDARLAQRIRRDAHHAVDVLCHQHTRGASRQG